MARLYFPSRLIAITLVLLRLSAPMGDGEFASRLGATTDAAGTEQSASHYGQPARCACNLRITVDGALWHGVAEPAGHVVAWRK